MQVRILGKSNSEEQTHFLIEYEGKYNRKHTLKNLHSNTLTLLTHSYISVESTLQNNLLH